MRDPTRRPPGSWPRDRPIRWGAVVGNLGAFIVGTIAALVQLGLVIPVLAVAGSEAGDGFGGLARIGLAMAWGGLTIFAAWSWFTNRWRVVLAPFATVAALWLVSTMAPS